MAVKVLHSTSAQHQEDFKNEAAILRRLRHPNVVNFLGLVTNLDNQVSCKNFIVTTSLCILL